MAVLAEIQINVEMRPAIAVERKIGRITSRFRAIILGMDIGAMSTAILRPAVCAAQSNAGLDSGYTASGGVAARQSS